MSTPTTQSGDIEQALRERITLACAQKQALRITGGRSKFSYQYDSTGEPLCTLEHNGIIEYEPAELVITARAGTALTTIEKTLHAQQQMLAFEPPHFTDKATIGGTIACGISGPRRPYMGAVRDFILGTKIINGQGDALSFGGRVMKNVAGYDMSRLMAGAMGTLGVITEISLKVLPKPEQEITLQFAMDTASAIKHCNAWANKALPISASCIYQDNVYLRLSGTHAAIQNARNKIGGEISDSENFWTSLREQSHPFFNTTQTLWRLSVAPATAPLALEGDCLIEWGGGQRWLKTQADSETVYALTKQAGGHATQFNQARSQRLLQTLDTPMLQLHQRLKHSLDPDRILNPGALYPDL